MKLIILLTVVVGISAAGTPETYRRLGLRGGGSHLTGGRFGYGGNFNNGRIVITDGAGSLGGGQFLVGGGIGGGRVVIGADGNRYVLGGAGGTVGAGRFISDGAGRIAFTRGGGGRFQLVGTGGAVDLVDSGDDDDGDDISESSSGSSTVVVSTGGRGSVATGGVIPVSRRVFPATRGTFPAVSRGIVPISSSGSTGVNVNFQGPIVDVTDQPTYFTTTRYGPVSSGGIRGSGDRSSSVDFTRSGTATGTLFSNDNAEATETAKKTVGYEYNYNEGYDYTQPRTLYSYDLREPIWGFADNAFHYTGDATVNNGGAVIVNGNGNGRIVY